MSTIKAIRERLHVTQAGLAEAIGCTQGNVWHYERPEKPQTVPPETAKKIIAFARSRGLYLTMDQLYGVVPLPPAEPAQPEARSA